MPNAFMMLQAIHSQIPMLVRTIGSSRDLLDILSDPPIGSQGLLTQVPTQFNLIKVRLFECICVHPDCYIPMQVVNTLTDGIVPSPDLVSTVKGLYNTKLEASMIIPCA